MKKFILKEGIRGMFSIDEENNDCNILDYINTNIDWIYQVDADGTIVLKDKDDSTICEKQVTAGDLVIKFYKKDYDMNRIVVVSSEEWKQNIEAAKNDAINRERKLRDGNVECYESDNE